MAIKQGEANDLIANVGVLIAAGRLFARIQMAGHHRWLHHRSAVSTVAFSVLRDGTRPFWATSYAS